MEILTRAIYIEPKKSKLDELLSQEAEKEVREQTGCVQQFYMIPVKKPYLRSLIYSFNWHSKENMIRLQMKETNRLHSYKWFSNLSEDESLVLVLLGDDNENYADNIKIEFTNLSLATHCATGSETFSNSPFEHALTFIYKDAVIQENEAGLNDDIDTEWERIGVSEE